MFVSGYTRSESDKDPLTVQRSLPPSPALDSGGRRPYAWAVTDPRAASPIDGLLVHTVGAVRLLTLARAERRNALTPDVARALAEQIASAAREDSLRVVMLRGAGGHFCVGLDLKWYLDLGAAVTDRQLEAGLTAFQNVIRTIVGAPLPVLAVLEGSVAGIGLDIALACDLRIAAATLGVASAFAPMGLIPDGGSTWTLPRIVGTGNALDLLLSGSTIDASRAREMGLVSAVHPAERIEEEATALAERLARVAPTSVRHIKQLVWGDELPRLERRLAAEGRAQLAALKSPEFRNRLQHFLSRER